MSTITLVLLVLLAVNGVVVLGFAARDRLARMRSEAWLTGYAAAQPRITVEDW